MTTEASFFKLIDVDVNFDIKFDTNIDLDKDVDVDVKIDADADIKGNITNLTLDAEALGDDTLVEADVGILTVENQLSSLTLVVISAAED